MHSITDCLHKEIETCSSAVSMLYSYMGEALFMQSAQKGRLKDCLNEPIEWRCCTDGYKAPFLVARCPCHGTYRGQLWCEPREMRLDEWSRYGDMYGWRSGHLAHCHDAMKQCPFPFSRAPCCILYVFYHGHRITASLPDYFASIPDGTFEAKVCTPAVCAMSASYSHICKLHAMAGR